MGDGKTTDLETVSQMTCDSTEDLRRQLLLLEIEENEKSRFDDVITGAESPNGWEDCWEEVTEDSVRSAPPSEWLDELSSSVTVSSPATLQERHVSAPNSYYELMDLNGEAVESSVRMARVPSQYQLDALSEMFIFDVPQHYAITQTPSRNQATNFDGANQGNADGTPFFVNSEYVSELLM